MRYHYTAYTAQQDGCVFRHDGTLAGARRKAIEYAKTAFPAWQYAGYGPVIVIRTYDSQYPVLEERL